MGHRLIERSDMSKQEKVADLKAAFGRPAHQQRIAKLMIGPNERARSQYPSTKTDDEVKK